MADEVYTSYNQQILSFLLKSQEVTEEQVKQAQQIAAQAQKNLGQVLVEQGFVTDEQLGKAKAAVIHVPFVRLSEMDIPDTVLRILPYSVASTQKVIVFGKTGQRLLVAMASPDNKEMVNIIAKKTGMEVEAYYATEEDIEHALQLYKKDVNERFSKLLKGALKDPSKIESLEDASKIVDTIISFAYQSSASDVHIEPRHDNILIRYRIDGILHDVVQMPKEIQELIVTRIKVLSNLRTDEHRAAQDGRFKVDLENVEVTLRVSILPVYDGEKVVFRLLISRQKALQLEELGYSKRNCAVVNDNIKKTHGMLLVTGPTGSGKTTTLYTILQMLNSREVNISTVEDPVEYRLEGVNQIQVNPKTNLTFAAGLRSILRQDPDIVMVGEIRDEETAGIAINAALTGHLVLATLHTNDAATTLPRLTEMGVENFLVSSTVNVVVAQRLVREICEKCKVSYQVTKEEFEQLCQTKNIDFSQFEYEQPVDAEGQITLHKGEGCERCGSTGYKGRSSIAEVIDVSDDMRHLILKNVTPDEILKKAREEGTRTMFEDGLEKVLAGVTTMEEVLRVIKE